MKKSYLSKLKIWTKRSNFLRPAFYDDDDDDDDDLSWSPKVQKLANTITEQNNKRQTEEKTDRQTCSEKNFSHGKTDRPI